MPVLYEDDEDFIVCCLCKKVLAQTSQKSAELDNLALRVLKLLRVIKGRLINLGIFKKFKMTEIVLMMHIFSQVLSGNFYASLM